MTIIPKIDNADYVTHYRSISLWNTAHKLITKIISNRIKPILVNLISPMQYVFLPSRHSYDNIIITQEVLHFMKCNKTKKRFKILKVDMAKAFDRLEWSFVKLVLAFINFPVSLIELIMVCLSTSQLCIFINGEPATFFSPSRGIRKGDLLSPYIFILCIDYLSLLITQVVKQQLSLPIKLSRHHSSPKISHLLFVNDILLFSMATVSSANTINTMLNYFLTILGQHINLPKSNVLFSTDTT